MILRPTRIALLTGLLAAGLVGINAWAYSRLKEQRAAVAAAAEELHQCQRLAAALGRLRGPSIPAGSKPIQPNDMIRWIEQSAQHAQVSMDHLVKIWPEPVKRIGHSRLKQAPTQLQLRSVDLQQLITLLHHLSSEARGLQVTMIRLAADQDNPQGNELWTAEATVTYVFDEPQSPQARAP
jgi:hypothetical protein